MQSFFLSVGIGEWLFSKTCKHTDWPSSIGCLNNNLKCSV